jgi:hypothetical protein
MPIFLEEENWERYLAPEPQSDAERKRLISTPPAGILDFYPVDNKAKGIELTQPLATPPLAIQRVVRMSEHLLPLSWTARIIAHWDGLSETPHAWEIVASGGQPVAMGRFTFPSIEEAFADAQKFAAAVYAGTLVFQWSEVRAEPIAMNTCGSICIDGKSIVFAVPQMMWKAHRSDLDLADDVLTSLRGCLIRRSKRKSFGPSPNAS